MSAKTDQTNYSDAMRMALTTPHDIHTCRASIMFAVEPEVVTSEWRSVAKQANYRTIMDGDLASESRETTLVFEILAELKRARKKFPESDVTMLAMVEEIGEIATALMEESQEAVQAECIQLATMCLRLILDGDYSVNLFRAKQNLDPLITPPEVVSAQTAALRGQLPKEALTHLTPERDPEFDPRQRHHSVDAEDKALYDFREGEEW